MASNCGVVADAFVFARHQRLAQRKLTYERLAVALAQAQLLHQLEVCGLGIALPGLVKKAKLEGLGNAGVLRVVLDASHEERG